MLRESWSEAIGDLAALILLVLLFAVVTAIAVGLGAAR